MFKFNDLSKTKPTDAKPTDTSVEDTSKRTTNGAELHFETKASGLFESATIRTTDGRVLPVMADLKTRTVFPIRHEKGE